MSWADVGFTAVIAAMFTIGVVTFLICFATLEGRMPLMGRWHRWRVSVEDRNTGSFYDDATVRKTIGVYVRRAGSKKVLYRALDPHADDFDSSIAEAVSEARQRAMSLNGAQQHGRRSLPR